MLVAATLPLWPAFGEIDLAGISMLLLHAPFSTYASAGDWRCRYIIQLGFAWAELDCGQKRGADLPSADPASSEPGANIPPLDKHIIRPGKPVGPPSSVTQESTLRLGLGPGRKLMQQHRH